MGDMNLNTMYWDTPFSEKSQYQKSQNNMVTMFKEIILKKGFKILNSTATRQKDSVEAKPACLDLMVTNNQDKIVSIQSGISCFKNHSLQSLHRRAKIVISAHKYLRIRRYKNFNRTQFKGNLINPPEYIEIFYENDPDTITLKHQKIIQESIDPLAPIQSSTKNTNKKSQKIKEQLVQRDIVLDTFKATNNIEDLRLYKHLKNKINKDIAK